MAYIPGIDCSQYNGIINWPKVTEQIAMVKMGGGDAGLYLDSMATKNYYGAKAAGKAVGGYWFAGGTDAVKEADYFVRAMSPLAVGDVLALDWEVSHTDPVQWCLAFATEVHLKTSVWPLLYINASTCNAYDWTPVLEHCGLWVADYSVAPSDSVPIKHVYIAQQYTEIPYDKTAWFMTLEQFKAYGVKAPDAPPKVTASTSPTKVTSTSSATTTLGKLGATLPAPTLPAPATVITPTPIVTASLEPLSSSDLAEPTTPIVNQPKKIPVDDLSPTEISLPVTKPEPIIEPSKSLWQRIWSFVTMDKQA